jgi:hypothetical protein
LRPAAFVYSTCKPSCQPCPPLVYSAPNIATSSAGRFASRLPCRRFLSERPVQCLKARRSLSTARGRSLASAFPSPATTSAFADPIPGSTALACCFAPSAACFPRPFGLSLHNPARSCSRSQLLHRPLPVALSATCLAGCALRLHSPSGLLPPSGSKRSAMFAACRPAFRSARSPFAPRRRFYH